MRASSQVWHSFLSILLLGMVTLLPVMAGIPPAGTSITNRAEVSWFDPQDGLVKKRYSNIAIIIVAPQFGVLFEDNNRRYASSGQIVDLPHRIKNIGNIASSYTLQIKQKTSDSGNLKNIEVFIDLNGNGVVDQGEEKLFPIDCQQDVKDKTCYSLPQLNTGKIVQFVIRGGTSINDLIGDTYSMSVSVMPLDHPDKIKIRQNTVTVIEGANINIIKTVGPVCGTPIKPNEIVKFTINFNNVGDQEPIANEIVIDNELLSGVVVEDTIQANLVLQKTTPLPIHAPVQSILLVQLVENNNSNRWVKFETWDGKAVVSKIGLFLPVSEMKQNQSGKLVYQLTANNKIISRTVSGAATLNLGKTVFKSNSVCVTLAPNSKEIEGSKENAKIRFLTPRFDLKKKNQAPDFYNDDDFKDASFYRMDHDNSHYQVARDGVYIEVHSTGLNDDDANVEIHTVKISSGKGDTLYVVIKETGVNTGIFRAIRPIRLSVKDKGAGQTCPAGKNKQVLYNNIIDGSCTLQGSPDGAIQVSMDDPGVGTLLKDAALIDPLGIVFDAAFNTPIKGATVVIRTPNGEIAIDPLTDEPYEIQHTKEDGKYQFPFLFPGYYYIDVVAPKNYSFPSKMKAEVFRSREVNQYSYGKDGYYSTLGSGVFKLESLLISDIPLDPNETIKNGLVLTKTVGSEVVSVGDFVNYSLKIENKTGQNLYAIKVEDHLPYGFRYVEGSTFLDKQSIDDPEGAPGPILTFSNLSFNSALDKKPHFLTYKARISAGGMGSDGINRAKLIGRTITSYYFSSKESAAKVKISQSNVLGDHGIIFGKVYVDADCSNLQSGGEWPIGGVKIYLENGTWVITDGNGQYSLYGIKTGNHMVKVDPISLPEGIILKPLDNRNMADGGSRLVDMKRGGFHRADFAAACPKEETEIIYEQIMARNGGNTDWMLDRASKYNPSKTTKNNNLPSSRADGDLSNGTVGFIRNALKAKIAAGKAINRGYSIELGRYADSEKAKKMQGGLPQTIQYRSFIYKTGDTYSLRFSFDLKKANMVALQSKFNDKSFRPKVVATIYERLPDAVVDRLESSSTGETMLQPTVAAKTITKKQGRAGTWLWPKNKISLDGRFMAVIRSGMVPTLRVNGKNIPKSKIGERISNRRERAQVVAWYGVELKAGDNQVEIFAKDPFGNSRTLAKGVFRRPVMAETLTFSSHKDELPADGGRSYLPLTIKLLDANGHPARGIHFVTLETSDGSWVERDIQDQTRGHQVRVMNGERVVHLRSSEHTGDITLRAYDGKMKAELKIVQTAPLRPLMAAGIFEIGASRSYFNNRKQAPLSQKNAIERHGRAAVFMKGRVRGDVHLTFAYDSDKKAKGERFRDINPNEQYPVYGDDSRRGYEAQSRSKLYAKIEKNKNSVMYGDYLTDSKTNHDSVARVQRSLTGFNAVIDTGKTRVQAYISRPEDGHIANEEHRGKGTALNYRMRYYPIVRNSEVLEIVTYSRDNKGVVINIRKMSRFGDYNVDDLTGDLSFSDVIPTVDENQNPVFIRVSYDVEGDGEKYTVAGVSVNQQIGKNLNVGLSHSYDDNASKGKTVTGISAEYKTKDTRITASAATLKHRAESKKQANAVRISVDHQWNEGAKTNVIYGRADHGYDNSSGGVTAGREELRVAHRQRLTKNVGVNVEAIHSKSLTRAESEQSVGVTADANVGDWTLKAGARHIKNTRDEEPFNTIIVGAKAPINIGKRRGNVFAEYEQDISTTERKRIAVGADLQVHDKVKLYTKAEQINSASGVSGLTKGQAQTTFSAGVRSNILPSTEIYSEYRLRGTTTGRDLETASGIKGDYELKKGLSVAPHLEVVKNIEDSTKDSVSVSLGAKDLRDKNARKSGRIEVRHTDKRDYVGVEGTYVSRLDEEWSMLMRDSARFDWNREKEELGFNNTFSIGLSLRPRNSNKHSMLFLYENKVKRGFGAEEDCSKNILSTHQSYNISETLTISGRLGDKYTVCSDEGVSTHSNTGLVDGRLIWDINKRFDIDLHGGVLTTNYFKERQYSAGVGLNYLVRENLRVGAGYNIKGFSDEDLDSEGYNKQGVYVGMQYKFDEKDLGWLSGEQQPDRNRVEIPTNNNYIDNDRPKKGALDTVKSWFGG